VHHESAICRPSDIEGASIVQLIFGTLLFRSGDAILDIASCEFPSFRISNAISKRSGRVAVDSWPRLLDCRALELSEGRREIICSV
jgi:hypothetical protein